MAAEFTLPSYGCLDKDQCSAAKACIRATRMNNVVDQYEEGQADKADLRKEIKSCGHFTSSMAAARIRQILDSK